MSKKHLELLPTPHNGTDLVKSGYLAISKRLAKIREESRKHMCEGNIVQHRHKHCVKVQEQTNKLQEIK